MIKANFHTHTTFCDGCDTAEVMACAAYRRGFSSLGFSGHSMYPFSSTWHIAAKEHKNYVAEISRLKKLYYGKMKILCGFEVEYIPGISVPRMEQYGLFNPDFLIGSVHYIVTCKGNFTVDDTIDKVKQGIKSLFNGNGKDAVGTYFSLQREMLQKGDFAIWGHPDVIRKRNGALRFFDEKDSWYRQELKDTARAAARTGVVAEINTGGIARNAIDDLYPSAEFLQILHDTNVPVIISSDAHSANTIDYAFDRAKFSCRQAGYTEVMYIDEGQIKGSPLI